MKYTKILRIFSIAFILSLLVVAIPATPAQAAREIDLDPEEGSIGDTITIVGEEFSASTETTEKYVNIYFSSDEASTIHYIDNQVNTYKLVKEGAWIDTDGELDATFTVPSELDDGSDDEDVEAGTTYYVYVTRVYYDPNYPATRIGAVAEFTVAGGEIALDPEEGPVGTEVEITGIDFIDREDIIIEYDAEEIDIEDGDDITDRDGEFASVILIPESIAGIHTITVTVAGSEVEAEFTVEPEITLAPTSGEANITVSVSGTGFGKREEVTIFFNNVGLATAAASRQGSFNTTFGVPELEVGIYNVDAEDADENTDRAKFTITVLPPPSPTPSPPLSLTTASISPSSGHVGTQFVIGGAGFEAGGTITIKYDDEEIDTASADSNGIFMAVLKVPVSKYGDHTITASDGTNIHQLIFTVESTLPPVPTPMLPEMGVEVEPPISFDWNDVAADSPPVTYFLQVATSKDFSDTSIVLDKKELTKSEYTSTEEEEIKLVGQETPYYWRIRAIDAASNEGEWTGAGIFYIAPSFAMPSWAIYTLIGLGGLVLFAVGYWLGRRTAYYS